MIDIITTTYDGFKAQVTYGIKGVGYFVFLILY
jgi:hypothetical protein